MYEDPYFAVAARRDLLRAEADRRRLVALVQCCRDSFRRRLGERLARLRTPAPCPTC